MKLIKLYLKELLEPPLNLVFMLSIFPSVVGVVVLWLFDNVFMLVIGSALIFFGAPDALCWLFIVIPNVVRLKRKQMRLIKHKKEKKHQNNDRL